MTREWLFICYNYSFIHPITINLLFYLPLSVSDIQNAKPIQKALCCSDSIQVYDILHARTCMFLTRWFIGNQDKKAQNLQGKNNTTQFAIAVFDNKSPKYFTSSVSEDSSNKIDLFLKLHFLCQKPKIWHKMGFHKILSIIFSAFVLILYSLLLYFIRVFFMYNRRSFSTVSII